MEGFDFGGGDGLEVMVLFVSMKVTSSSEDRSCDGKVCV